MQPNVQAAPDIRDVIFSSVCDQIFTAHITAETDGIIAGAKRAAEALTQIGLSVMYTVADGTAVTSGEIIATFTGKAKQMAMAEEVAIGIMAKPSGIATAACKAVAAAGSDLRIVCGAWKKMPPEIKFIVREAVADGRASFRITDQPFLYLDKNFIRMLGGIEATLHAVKDQHDKLKVIQLKGDFGEVSQEALTAAKNGADIIMVDTGYMEDVVAVNRLLSEHGYRKKIQIAFAKGIKQDSIEGLKGKGIDILDIGTGIIDAPLLDMKMDVRLEGGL